MNVIVLIEDKDSMEIYKRDYDTLLTGKQILILYSEKGMYILENYVASSKNTVEALIQKINALNYTVCVIKEQFIYNTC
ncbi:hypothetical protein [Clostridium algidicarnis]|uniref:hypothetical protein n=1 Tax=Clostridium algidicarnis TaxID=37659 RepID=UPI001C0B484A|nr:hypothetical protein [Clostridium algidicarnis]MBU3193415.1 hypothetical protein [Clostridium algidicarnis]